MIKITHQTAIYAGALLLIIAFVWWQQTFGARLDYIKCFAFSGGICRTIAVDGYVYTPIVFWIGVICVATGIGLKKYRKL